jgi:hypothetical protein
VAEGSSASYPVAAALSAEVSGQTVRRGDILTVTVTVNVATGTLPTDVAPQIVVAPSALVAVGLPAACASFASGTVACNVTATPAAVTLQLVVPPSSTAAAVAAAVHVAEWNAVAGGYRNVTAPATQTLSTVFASRTLAQLSVAATTPAMNRIDYGTTVTLAGANLDLLPSRVWVGPVFADVAVASSLATAAFTIPAAAFTQASSTPLLTAAAAYNTDAKHKLLAPLALTARDQAAIALVRGAVADGSTVPLHRFNFHFAAAHCFVNPEVAAPGASVVIGTAAATVPAAPMSAVDHAAGTTSMAVFSSNASGLRVGTVLAMQSTQFDAAATTISGASPVAVTSAGGSWSTASFAGVPALPSVVSDNSPVGLITPATAFNATISATNAAVHTNYTVASRYAVSAFATRITLLAGYQATVSLEHASGTVTGVSLLAYTDRVSSVGFATTSATAGCVVSRANHSVTCTPGLSLASTRRATSTVVLLSVTAPAYFKRDVVVRLHVTATNAQPVDVRIRMQRTVATASAVFFEPSSTIAPVVDPAVAAVTPATPPEEQALGNDEAARGVFSLTGGCTIPKFPVVATAFVAFVVLTACHLLHQLATKRRPVDQIVTIDVAPLIGLLPQHAYVGALYPCHRRCGPTHAAQLLVHVLCITTVASSLLISYFAMADADFNAAVVFGLTAAFAATMLRPVTAAAFGMYRINDERAKHMLRKNKYRPQDLTEFGQQRYGEVVGLSRASMGHFSNPIFDYEEDPFAEGKPQAERAASVVTAEKPNSGIARTPQTGVLVEARNFALVGFAVCAVLAIGFAAATLANTAPWCGRRIAAFERVVLCAVVADVTVLQPLYLLFLWLWRWMVSEEQDGHAIHELHPIDNQWRIVGLVEEMVVFDDDDDAEEDRVRAAAFRSKMKCAAPVAAADGDSTAAAANFSFADAVLSDAHFSDDGADESRASVSIASDDVAAAMNDYYDGDSDGDGDGDDGDDDADGLDLRAVEEL